MAQNGDSNYLEAFGDDKEALALFLKSMRKFEELFCEYMFSGSDFTLGLEARGNERKIIHCRVKTDGFDRPKESKQTKAESDAKRRKPSKRI